MFNLENISYTYASDGDSIEIEKFEGAQGSRSLVLGRSGSGKSTLIKLLSGLLTPDSGRIEICGKDIHLDSENERDRFRGENIGIIFQGNHLLETLTVEENLALANFSAGLSVDRNRIDDILHSLEIQTLADRYPNNLSQGQRQRVAIARSLVNSPSIILADEPTSSLDDYNTSKVLDLLFRESEKLRATLLVATHDQRVKSEIDTIYQLN